MPAVVGCSHLWFLGFQLRVGINGLFLLSFNGTVRKHVPRAADSSFYVDSVCIDVGSGLFDREVLPRVSFREGDVGVKAYTVVPIFRYGVTRVAVKVVVAIEDRLFRRVVV